MKVTITQIERQYFEITKEVEISEQDYKNYMRNGQMPQHIINDLCSLTDEEYHTKTEILTSYINFDKLSK